MPRKLDLSSEPSIRTASHTLYEAMGDGYLHTAFLTGGVLYPERTVAELNMDHIMETFQINAISHLMMIKVCRHASMFGYRKRLSERAICSISPSSYRTRSLA